MCYMSDGMEMSVQLAGFRRTFGRLAGGGSLFQVTYSNNSPNDGYIAMTPDYPGRIACDSDVVGPVGAAKSFAGAGTHTF